MADVPRFAVLPPLRCCQQDPDCLSGICGELATWQRPGLARAGTAFFCDYHRNAIDVPIAGELVFRRVSITIEAVFAGTSPIPGLARTEALERLEKAVQHAGGLISIQAATDVVGRYAPPTGGEAVGDGRRRG